ncbi:MAG: acyl-CoA dehydrogenase family protein [Vicinamibacterales bacterium]
MTPAWGLTPDQEAFRRRAESFARTCIRPRAAAFDEEEAIPREVFRHCGQQGFLGANVGALYDGSDVDHVRMGLLHYAIGRACSSLRSILTVHGMVCEVLQRWGSAEQRARWLPRLARGDALAAFALTEAEAGSDVKAIRTTAVKDGQGYALTGEKCWITGGQIADVFLVFARDDGKDAAYLLDRAASGLTVKPQRAGLGLRAAMLASMTLADCLVPPDDRVGPPGFGLDAIAATALDLGRFTVAWGCLGLAEACLEASLRHADSRTQFGRPLREHQLVGAMLSEMVVGVRAVSLVCLHAAKLRDSRDEAALLETCAAKHLAARTCARIAADAVQVHGAAGCAAGHEAERWYRDAKVMEIIEGSTQLQQTLIARLAYDTMHWE